MKHDLILISLQWPEGTWCARLDLLHGLPSLLSDLKSEGDKLVYVGIPLEYSIVNHGLRVETRNHAMIGRELP